MERMQIYNKYREFLDIGFIRSFSAFLDNNGLTLCLSRGTYNKGVNFFSSGVEIELSEDEAKQLYLFLKEHYENRHVQRN